MECWTALSALASTVPRYALGPLVLNVVNRDPGVLAVMAATLQQVSAGRLLLGLGAGARAGTPYTLEQEALGRQVPADGQRRLHVEHTIAMLRRVWSRRGASGSQDFLQPEPIPPILVAGLGPKMAELAGGVGDGICVPVGSTMAGLVTIARRATRNRAGLLKTSWVAATLPSVPEQTLQLRGLDIDRLIVYLARPFDENVLRLGQILHNWNGE